jgi:hypothetical protein
MDDMLFDGNVVIFWTIKEGMSCSTIFALKHFKLFDMVFALIFYLTEKLIVESALLESCYEFIKTQIIN